MRKSGVVGIRGDRRGEEELGEEEGEGKGGVSKRAHLLGTRNEWIVTFMTNTIKKGEHC